MVDILTTIRAINPDAEATVYNEDIDQITWHNNTPVISNKDILAKQTELELEWTAQEYARSRKIEYDALNQLELMTDDAINGTTTHLDAINEIKAKYPKPE